MTPEPVTHSPGLLDDFIFNIKKDRYSLKYLQREEKRYLSHACYVPAILY